MKASMGFKVDSSLSLSRFRNKEEKFKRNFAIPFGKMADLMQVGGYRWEISVKVSGTRASTTAPAPTLIAACKNRCDSIRVVCNVRFPDCT